MIRIPGTDPITKKRNWRGFKKIHEWAYVGVNKETGEEFGQCQICDKFRGVDNRPVSKKEIDRLQKAGLIEIR